MPTKVILDTDIGSDIDDAVALAYLLAQPECDLLGITTVTGEPVKRASMASALCKVVGKEVPIYPGLDKPILTPQHQLLCPQASSLTRWPHETKFSEAEAIEFLQHTIRANPGEVTLLAIGPLTNIGLLFAVDPEIPGLLKSLVLMCGSFLRRDEWQGMTEWNAIGDPYATAIVYQAPVKIHRSLGLDVTSRVNMKADEVRRRFTHSLLAPVLDFAEVWFKEREWITWHDPLAAATIFDPSPVRFARGTVEVELASYRLRGLTHWTPGDDGPHEIGAEVDADRFFDHYFSVFA